MWIAYSAFFISKKNGAHLRAPGFRVEYVGDPMRAKYQDLFPEADKALFDPSFHGLASGVGKEN